MIVRCETVICYKKFTEPYSRTRPVWEVITQMENHNATVLACNLLIECEICDFSKNLF